MGSSNLAQCYEGGDSRPSSDSHDDDKGDDDIDGRSAISQLKSHASFVTSHVLESEVEELLFFVSQFWGKTYFLTSQQ